MMIQKDPELWDLIEKIKDQNEDQDFFSAIKICKKKRIGPARIDDNRSLFYKKDISLLARNGFDFETSKKVMDLKKEDYICSPGRVAQLVQSTWFTPKGSGVRIPSRPPF